MPSNSKLPRIRFQTLAAAPFLALALCAAALQAPASAGNPLGNVNLGNVNLQNVGNQLQQNLGNANPIGNIPVIPGLPGVNLGNINLPPNVLGNLLGGVGIGNLIVSPAFIKMILDRVDVGNAVTKPNRLEKVLPSRKDDFGLMIANEFFEKEAELLIKNTMFEYDNMKALIHLAFEVAAKYLNYSIKQEDELYLNETIKKILAITIDETRGVTNDEGFSWNVENQLFECFDSFFAPRSDVYAKRSPIERRQMFNVISDGPIYKNDAPLPSFDSGVRSENTHLAFPDGHPYHGYSIFKCTPHRFLWYIRYSIKKNVEEFKKGLAKEDAEYAHRDAGKAADNAAKLRTMAEMYKYLREKGTGQKLLREGEIEARDILSGEGPQAVTKTNTGEMLEELKNSGYSVKSGSQAEYDRLWRQYSDTEK